MKQALQDDSSMQNAENCCELHIDAHCVRGK
jgi:hypothetical protein